MIVLQPLYVGADRGRTGFDAAVIALDNGLGRGNLAGGVVEIADDIVMQRTLIALKRQDIVAALIDDLLGNLTLAVQRVDGHDRAFQRQHLQQLRNGGPLGGDWSGIYLVPVYALRSG